LVAVWFDGLVAVDISDAVGEAIATYVNGHSMQRRVPNEIMDSLTVGIPHNSPFGYYVKNVLYTQYFTPDGASLHDNYWSSNFGGAGSHGVLGGSSSASMNCSSSATSPGRGQSTPG
jgi:hypothetical protein